jgi:phosphoadenosine phosphosulfate reductase
MTPHRHGKTEWRWCDACGTLLLGEKCDRCASPGRAFPVSLPGDVRPALRRGVENVRGLFLRHFGTASFLDGRALFFNKLAGEDRADEVIYGGRCIANIRFDLKEAQLKLDLRVDGAMMLAERAVKNVVAIHGRGHLKGKSVGGADIIAAEGRFAEGEPLLVRAGGLMGAGAAKASSDEVHSTERSVLVRDIGKLEERPLPPKADRDVFVACNRAHLERLEAKAVSDMRSYFGNRKLPQTLSFSGGKDSLACYGLMRSASSGYRLIFIDTGLEFPETVRYVNDFARRHHEKLLVASAGNAFWEQVGAFGPPAKDFRWCCKVCKLGPVTDLIEKEFPKGTVTVEGNRALESFARSQIGFVESNPFVPNQTILNPIRDWTAAEVWGYIWLRGLAYNPLYEEDMERIGCYLCASCLGSEWRETARLHPQLHARWEEWLKGWAGASGGSEEMVRYGFWRWKVMPPKMRQLAEEVGLKVPRQRADTMDLRMTKGVSPCAAGGYSIEGVLRLPQRHRFNEVGEALKTVGDVKTMPEFEIALARSKDRSVKAFGGGQIVAVAPTPEAAEQMFAAGARAYLRGQMCTRCGICVKNCRERAISVEIGLRIDERRCTRCRRCEDACVVAHYYDKLVRGPEKHSK